jgi:predicted dehydrogenase
MIGCGAIARQYLDTAHRLDAIEIVAAADRVPARATAVEAAEGIPAMPVADLLANAEVDVVLNLTIPAAHAAIALQAIAAGKAVYGEKPLAATTAEARSILEAAGAAGV